MADLHGQHGARAGVPRSVRAPLTPKIAAGHRRAPQPGIAESELVVKDEPRKGLRRWLILLGLALTALLGSAGFVYLASEASESPRFRVHAEEVLSQQLLASVEIAPISASGLFYVRTPEIRITDPDGAWTIRLEQVGLEIARESFTSNSWRLSSCHAAAAYVNLGPAPEVPEMSNSGSPSLASRLAEKLGLGAFGVPEAVLIPEFSIGKLVVRGWREGGDKPGFQLEAPARGAYENGVLAIETEAGTFDPGEIGAPWNLDEFAAVIDPEVGVSIDAGQLSGERDSVIRLLHRGPDPADNDRLRLEVEFERARVKAGNGEALDPLLGALTATGKGDLRIPLNNPLDFEFLGAVEFGGVELSRSDLFELLADQTGEPRLRKLLSERITAEIQWKAGDLKIDRISFEAANLARITGSAKLAGSQLTGEIQLEFPSEIIGRIPGGKPVGFSYPASGWSQAQIQLHGSLADFDEDLSKRLLAQVAPEVTVLATPKVKTDTGSAAPDLSPAAVKERQETLERLFFGLIGKDKDRD